MEHDAGSAGIAQPAHPPMLTIGLLGGMSWESTATYYRLLNEGVRQELGGLHGARLVLNSLDFAEIEGFQQRKDEEGLAAALASGARRVEAAGADFLLVCTNTMHEYAATIEAALGIPLLHIADATGQALRDRGIGCVGVLGTGFTMQRAFYTRRLRERWGLDVVLPREDERAVVHRVIYEELCRGKVLPASRESYRRVMAGMVERGAEGIALACTEIGLLVGPEDASVPLFDTTELHCQAALRKALDRTQG